MPKPVVLFMTPDKYTMAYATMMKKLSAEALISLGKSPDEVELIGYVSQNAEQGSATLIFLNRSGIDAYNVLALVLFGEAGDQFDFHSSGSDDCVLGSVVVPSSSVAFPTLCIPSLETGWLSDPANWESIKVRYISLMKNGRKELTAANPYTYVTRLMAGLN